eukprot:scaffold117180_cov62-Phaeocystis_antarctica.AAC.1
MRPTLWPTTSVWREGRCPDEMHRRPPHAFAPRRSTKAARARFASPEEHVSCWTPEAFPNDP